MNTTVIIADDHAIIREGLKGLLENKGIRVLGIAKDGREAMEKTVSLKPEVVIMDVSMPSLNGVEATKRIKKQVPDARIIALSMHSGRRTIDRMFAAGASGYILKESAFNELYDAIREVVRGNYYLTPSVARMYVDPDEDFNTGPSGIDRLSGKEREVLQLVAEGGKTRDIAESLGVSVKTVETHRRNIMKKLNIFSVAGLTRFAIKEGIIPLE